jgi:hypothetical protein
MKHARRHRKPPVLSARGGVPDSPTIVQKIARRPKPHPRAMEI